jgi:predicted nucleic acid-binding Zn ribbon protein
MSDQTVTSCPKCGAPIYTDRPSDSNPRPTPQYTCDCRSSGKSTQGTTRTGMFKTGAN